MKPLSLWLLAIMLLAVGAGALFAVLVLWGEANEP
jgi:hypothetical protein